ncbi:MAG: hypothetical protein SFT91_05730 [Rickettsiaceae bacterium]|nr:hypothetical protein [Rickettsiaceae bacterium]
MHISQNFDTHKFVKSFVVAGMSEDQAEAIVTAIVQSRDADLSRLATKEQIELLRLQIESVKLELEGKIDSFKSELDGKIDSLKTEFETKLDSRISKQEASLLKWFITTSVAMTGIIIAAIKFTH